MIRIALLLPFAVGACASGPAPIPPPDAEMRPVVATDSLQGRWTITTVNGRQGNGLWLELGGEGLATVTTIENAVFVASPQPQTRAFLGCNDWYPSGWTRNATS